MSRMPFFQTFNHILIIEDDPAIASVLQKTLKREGFNTTWKSTGREGLDYLLQGNLHLVVLDLRLPDGSGLDVCREIRQKKIRVPVLILTVRGEEMDKVIGLEIGADDYMTKPFSTHELLSRVRALLRRAYGELSNVDAEILYIRELVIDRSQGQAWRGEQPLNLTPTEFRLLVYLARHPGQALTRAQIIEDVWGYAGELSDDRTVNVYIRRLREKIELNSDRPSQLLTVPGIGYRLVT
jgi:DNA-binding response OmpR family regulator